MSDVCVTAIYLREPQESGNNISKTRYLDIMITILKLGNACFYIFPRQIRLVCELTITPKRTSLQVDYVAIIPEFVLKFFIVLMEKETLHK